MTGSDHATEVDVRQVRPGEWRAIKEVRLAMLRAAPSAYVTTVEEALAYLDQIWIDRAVVGSLGEVQLTVLAFDGDTPIGMAAGLRKARFGKPVLAIVSVYLADDFRGTGVTDEMFHQIEAWGGSWGATHVTLWVGDGNERAFGFYTKAGYEMTLDRAKLTNGSGLWETRMEKSLEPKI